MISETEHKRHVTDLEFLQTSLQNVGINSVLIQASEENPVSFLSGNMPTSYSGPAAVFNLMYIPAENILEEISLLQIYTSSTYPLETIQQDVKSFISEVNNRSILGYFGITDENIFHRYVYSLPRFEVPNETVFLEILGLCFSNYGQLSELIIKVANQEYTLEEAIKKLI